MLVYFVSVIGCKPYPRPHLPPPPTRPPPRAARPGSAPSATRSSSNRRGGGGVETRTSPAETQSATSPRLSARSAPSPPTSPPKPAPASAAGFSRWSTPRSTWQAPPRNTARKPNNRAARASVAPARSQNSCLANTPPPNPTACVSPLNPKYSGCASTTCAPTPAGTTLRISRVTRRRITGRNGTVSPCNW